MNDCDKWTTSTDPLNDISSRVKTAIFCAVTEKLGQPDT